MDKRDILNKADKVKIANKSNRSKIILFGLLFFIVSCIIFTLEATQSNARGSVDAVSSATKKATPAPVPTKAPTPVPTKAPTPVPTKAPTPTPTKSPTTAPGKTPAPIPVKSPTPAPVKSPAPVPAKSPTPVPGKSPAPGKSPTPGKSPVPAKSPAPALSDKVAVPDLSKGIALQERNVKISTGVKKVKIIWINPKDSRISFEVNIPGSRLNNTGDFEKQVKDKKAFAAINGNFFDAHGTIKDPIGNIMVNGKLIYGQSGLTTVGITFNKDIIFSKPGTFVAGTTREKIEDERTGKDDGNDDKYGNDSNDSNDSNDDSVDNSYDNGLNYYKWSASEINTMPASENSAVIYTPERGKSIYIPAAGYVAVVEGGIVKDSYFREEPHNVDIPSNGYVVFYGKNATESELGYKALKAGRTADYKYLHLTNTNKDFSWDKMQWAVTGGPDLIFNGKPAPVSTRKPFTGERFTTLSTPRTVIAVTKNKQLMLVSVASAKISELKEILKALGAYQAVNLDGGDSAAMYYNGKTLVKPARKLETVLYVYKK